MALKEKIELVLEAENSLLVSVNNLKNNAEIKIATYASVAKHVLPELIKEYKLNNKNVKFSISVTGNLKPLIKAN